MLDSDISRVDIYLGFLCPGSNWRISPISIRIKYISIYSRTHRLGLTSYMISVLEDICAADMGIVDLHVFCCIFKRGLC